MIMKNKLFISFLILICSVEFVKSQTNVSGGIFTNTVWTKVNSPYTVTDTVVVFPGVTLTIQPGVTVKFKDSINMEIRGTLLAIGSPTDTIHFTSVSQKVTFPNAMSGPLTGIRINVDLGGKTTVNYAKFTYIDGGISWENWTTSGVTSSVSNSLFYRNTRGLLGETYYWTYINVNKCTFLRNEIGIGYSWYYNVRGCTFKENGIGITGDNINADNSTFCGNITAIDTDAGVFDSLTITKNSAGLKLANSNGISVRNCYIFANDTGIVLGMGLSTSTDTVTSNSICNNNLYNVVHTDSYNFNMANNCWCTTNTVSIASKIYDAYDNFTLGIINFAPFSNCTSTVLPTGINCNYFTTNFNAPRLNDIFLKIFPNPNNGSFVIQTDNEIENGELKITNSLGQTVLQKAVFHSDKLSLSIAEQPVGIYFVEIKTKEENFRTKIVKE